MKHLTVLCAAMLLFSACESRTSAPPAGVASGISSADQSTQNFQENQADVPAFANITAENPASAGEDEQPAADSNALISGDSSAAAQQLVTTTLTIPEGTTLAKIGMILEEKEICTAQEFIAASQETDYSKFPLIAAQQKNPNRCFKLEGYLFPDTYEIYTTESPQVIIERILAHTEKKISDQMRAQIANSGYSIDEIITMASIIEKEAFGHEQMPMISSVLHNRLKAGMQLQCDVSIVYVEGAIKPFISGDQNRYNSHYNTYKCPALPAGAICNPGYDAIMAALNPAESSYIYFLTDKEKNYYYAETWEEHQQNIKDADIQYS